MQEAQKDAENDEAEADTHAVKPALGHQDVVGALRADVCVVVT